MKVLRTKTANSDLATCKLTLNALKRQENEYITSTYYV